MTKEKHNVSQTIVDRLSNFQRKVRFVAGLVPSRKLPLLTPAEAFGPDLERFRDQQQAIVSWRDKQSQSWGFYGNLKTSRGRPFAFQLSFVDRHTQNDFLGVLPTRWLTPRAFSARFALTDPMNGEAKDAFRGFERGGLFSRSTGYAADDRFHLELDGWHAYSRDDGSVTLAAADRDVSLHLELRSSRPRVYHGQSGYVNREMGAAASFSCSDTRLAASGRLVIDGRLEDVTGIVWLDHEKITATAGARVGASNKIMLQFESGEDLMIFDQGPSTFGTWVRANGETQHLVASEIKIENVEYWKSPATGARYPLKRKITLEPLNLTLDVRPIVQGQELDLFRSMFSSSWSGAISAAGAVGFMELSGYDRRPRSRAAEFLIG